MKIETALAGNRTRASRVAGENSTTEPPVLLNIFIIEGSVDLQPQGSMFETVERY